MPDLSAWQASDWSAFGQIVTAVVAVVASVFAYSQVREARRAREDQIRPFVVVDIQPSPVWGNILNLVVENIGATLARDVRLTFNPPLATSIKDYAIGASVLITEGIPALPPRRQVTAMFDISHDRVNTDLPMRYQATVALSDARGRPQETIEYIIDLGFLYGLRRVNEYGMHHAAKALQGIEQNVKRWTGSHGRLNVWVRDEDEHDQLDRIEHDLTGEFPSLGTALPSELVMRLGRSVFVRTAWRRLREYRARQRA